MANWTALVGIDGSASSERALRWAAKMADVRNGSVRAFNAYEIPGNLEPRLAQEVDEGAARRADELLDQAVRGVELPHVPIEREVRAVQDGAVAKALFDAADGVDLLVTGSRGVGGFMGLLVGSVSAQAVGHAPCPVAVIPAPDRGPEPTLEGDVMVGVDDSPGARAALEWAVDEVRRGGGRLILLHVTEDPKGTDLGDTDVLDEPNAAQKLAREAAHDLDVVPHTLPGTPSEALANHAEDARLLVVGTRGRGGFTGLLLGSVSQQVVQHAACPTVVVKQP